MGAFVRVLLALGQFKIDPLVAKYESGL